MRPTQGRTVDYWFRAYNDRGEEMLVNRPAVVTGVHAEFPSRVNLHVFYEPQDLRLASSASMPGAPNPPTVWKFWIAGVSAHQEATGEIGVVEKMPPRADTWSWPKRVP